MNSTFLLSFRTELMKIKRTAALWVVIIGGAFMPLLFTLMYLSKPKVFVPRMKLDPWMNHFRSIFQGGSFFLLPMFVILVASLIAQVEFRNNTWKQVMASPLKIGDVFFSKYIVVQLMVIATYLLMTAWVLVSGTLTALFNSDYKFLHTPIPWRMIAILNVKSYIAMLGLSTIQYCLSLRFKNFIGAIGTGLGLLIVGLTIITWDKVVYFPYAYPALTFINWNSIQGFALSKHEYWSLGYMVAFLALGFADFSLKRERG